MKSLIFLLFMFLGVWSSAQNNAVKYPGFDRFLKTDNANIVNSFAQKSGLINQKMPIQLKPEDFVFQAETSLRI